MKRNDELKLRIKSTYDPAGVRAADDGLKGLGATTQRVTRATTLLRSAMSGLGVIAVIQGLVRAWESISAVLSAAKTKAEQLKIAQEQAASTAAVDALSAAYGRLSNTIKDTNVQLQRQAELQDHHRTAAQAQEDAAINLAEQEELSALDRSHPDYALEVAQISTKYAGQRARLGASRLSERHVLQRQELQFAADSQDDEAAQKEAWAADAYPQQRAMASRAVELSYRSRAALRYKWDITGGADVETPISKDLAKAAETSKANAEKLAQQIAEAETEAKTLRMDAKHKRALADELLTQIQAAGTASRATYIKATRADVTAADALTTATQEREARAQALADKQAQAASARTTAGEAQTELDALRARADQEANDVSAVQLQIDATTARFAGSRNIRQRDRALAPHQADLARETSEAAQANATLARAIPALSQIIKDNLQAAQRLEAEVAQLRTRQGAQRLPQGNID